MRTFSLRRAPALGLAAMTLAGFVALGVRCASDDQKSSTPASAQGGAHVTALTPPVHTTPLLVDVNMVLVNVTVTDPFDRIVTGLDQENFQVYDEKVEQKVVAFSTEDAPISVGLIFDCSGSMGDKIQKSKEAAL